MTTSTSHDDTGKAQANHTDPGASAEQGRTLAFGETVEYVDPTEIELGPNVRTEASVGKAFVASVKADGFYQYPSTYRRTSDGVIVLVKGQRRILAARMAELPRVPVVVGPEPTGDEKTREIQRIVHQHGENHHREELTKKDDFAAVEQMFNLGVSPAQTAKRLHIPRPHVDAAATVAKSDRARAELHNTGLDLVQLATLSEFDDDQDAVATLIEAAGKGQFEHVAEQLRARNAKREKIREAAADYTAAGYTLTYRRPDIWGENRQCPLRDLVTADGTTVNADDIDPTKFTVFLVEETETVDTETGEPVADDEIDWDTDDDPNLEPEEGFRHANTVTERSRWVPSFYCHDLPASGYTDRCAAHPGDNEEAAAARQQEAARREEENRQIKSTRASQARLLNPLCRTATTVRRRWVESEGLASHRKGMAVWAARQLAARPALLGEAGDTAAELLGYNHADIADGTAFLGAGDTRAQLIICGLVFGALENRVKDTADGSWRNVPGGVPDYLRYLRELGYNLSEIEEVMIGERKPEDVTPTE